MNMREALQAVYDHNGRLTPALVVEEARDPASPLHGHIFNLDETQAAERYYLDRAHRLIQSFKIKHVKDSGEQLEIRQWVAVSSPEISYKPATEVIGDPITRQLALRDMRRQWNDLKSRYDTFEEFAAMVLGDLAATGS